MFSPLVRRIRMSGIARKYGIFILALWEFPTLISIVAASVHNPINREQGCFFCLPQSFPAFVVDCFADFCHFNWGKMKSQSCLDLNFPNQQECGKFLKIFFSRFLFSFENSLFRSQVYVFELVLFYILSALSYLCILDINLLSDVYQMYCLLFHGLPIHRFDCFSSCREFFFFFLDFTKCHFSIVGFNLGAKRGPTQKMLSLDHVGYWLLFLLEFSLF